MSGTTFGIIKALQQKPRNHTTPPSTQEKACQLLDARIHYPVHKHPTATQTPIAATSVHTQRPHTKRGNLPHEAGEREGPVWQAVPAPSQENKHPAEAGPRLTAGTPS